MEAIHHGLPIANKISLPSLKSKNPGLFVAPLALVGTCVDPQGECSSAQASRIWFLFSASKANGIQMGAPLDPLQVQPLHSLR